MTFIHLTPYIKYIEGVKLLPMNGKLLTVRTKTTLFAVFELLLVNVMVNFPNPEMHLQMNFYQRDLKELSVLSNFYVITSSEKLGQLVSFFFFFEFPGLKILRRTSMRIN